VMESRVRILSTDGRTLMEGAVRQDSEWPLEKLPAGIFLMEMELPSGIQRQQLIRN